MRNPIKRRVDRTLRDRILRPVEQFAELEAASGFVLLTCTLLALIWANSRWAEGYFEFWQIPLSIGFGRSSVSMPVQAWVNEGLMSLFFLVVGLEIKREIIVGELSDPKRRALPLAAALGGMIVPACIFLIFNGGGEGASGWGIPMATDIAFSLGVLSLVKSIPIGLRVFLAALAIVDDIGAVLVIAVFYTARIDWAMLGCAGIVFVAVLALNRAGARSPVTYLVIGISMWAFLLNSGVHATIAGVLLAAAVPARAFLGQAEFAGEVREAIGRVESGHPEGPMTQENLQSAIHTLGRLAEVAEMPVDRLRHLIEPLVTFGIMPIFALANAGVRLDLSQHAILGTVPLGIFFGLVLGKPLGITLFAWVACRWKLCSLPAGTNIAQILGIGVLGGIGFTMSLFIGQLAFTKGSSLEGTKLAILAASIVAGAAGWLMLKPGTRRPGTKSSAGLATK